MNIIIVIVIIIFINNVATVIIFIVSIFTNAIKNISRIIIVKSIRGTVTSFMKNVIMIITVIAIIISINKVATIIVYLFVQ